MNIQPKAAGLAFGAYWGVSTMMIAFTAAYWHYGTPWVDLFSGFYIGYAPTVAGALIGLLWGFADGFVFGALVAWLYNFFSQK
ncbi:MAG: bacteriophage holin [Candidatus Melainabacteria bacterium]